MLDDPRWNVEALKLYETLLGNTSIMLIMDHRAA